MWSKNGLTHLSSVNSMRWVGLRLDRIIPMAIYGSIYSPLIIVIVVIYYQILSNNTIILRKTQKFDRC
jgi:hypothetical protein